MVVSNIARFVLFISVCIITISINLVIEYKFREDSHQYMSQEPIVGRLQSHTDYDTYVTGEHQVSESNKHRLSEVPYASAIQGRTSTYQSHVKLPFYSRL
jgi:hypothetical protein